jgi:photosystem II stability/assembly factor-like uncharacterized protein
MRRLLTFCGIATAVLFTIPGKASAQWEQASAELDASAFAASGTLLMVGTNAKGIFMSADNGDAWVAADSGLPTDPSFPSSHETVNDMVIGSENVYAAIHGAGVYHLSDDISHWVAGNAGLPANGYGNIFVYTLVSKGTDIFAGTIDGGVYRFTEGGSSWTQADQGLPLTPYAHVWSFAVSGTNLFASTDSGVFRSADNGTSWTEADAGLPAKGYQYVRCLAASGTDLFAGCGGSAYGVYRSGDNGASWVAADSGLPSTVTSTALASSGTNLFAGTEYDGVFFSGNQGASWTALNSGLPAAAALSGVSSLAVCGTSLFAGMIFYIKNEDTGRFDEFRSIWRYALTSASKDAPRQALPRQLSLKLTPSYRLASRVTATFFLPQPQLVCLDLYDLSGKKIVSVVKGRLGAGTHTALCPTRGLTSGSYVVRLQAGAVVQAKPLQLLR